MIPRDGMVHQVVGANGLKYRGPISCASPKTPWRVTCGTGGNFKTAEKFTSQEQCLQFLDRVEAAAQAHADEKAGG